MARLADLVRFVLDTSPDNESTWVEWKIGLDLTKAEGRFAVAKQILGFANRDPRLATAHGGGCGYMVLGAEPGNLAGQPGMDPADVDAGVRSYVGADGPAWAPQTVRVDGVDVVVVTVEPPEWGDPIHALRKQFASAHDGMVFVRRPGGTHPASSGEVAGLGRRSLNRPEGLDLVLTSVGDPLPRVDLGDSAVEEWIAAERRRLLAPLSAEEHRLAGNRSKRDDRLGDLSRLMPGSDLSNLGGLQKTLSEDRTPDEYRAQVEDYLAIDPNHVRLAAMNQFEDVVDVRLELRVVNTSARNLESVEVIVSFPGPVFSCEQVDIDELSAPRTWGPRRNPVLDVLANNFVTYNAPLLSGFPHPGPGYTAQNTGSTVIEFDAFDLRPHREYELPDVGILVSAALTGSIDGTWTATATNRDGRAQGKVSVALADTHVSVIDLLA